MAPRPASCGATSDRRNVPGTVIRDGHAQAGPKPPSSRSGHMNLRPSSCSRHHVPAAPGAPGNVRLGDVHGRTNAAGGRMSGAAELALDVARRWLPCAARCALSGRRTTRRCPLTSGSSPQSATTPGTQRADAPVRCWLGYLSDSPRRGRGRNQRARWPAPDSQRRVRPCCRAGEGSVSHRDPRLAARSGRTRRR